MDISAIMNNIQSNMQTAKSEKTDSIGFQTIIDECTSTNSVSVEDRVENLFGKMNVTVKFGTCNVTKENWDRNQFPFWNYFDENTSADALNNWSATGTDCAMTDSYVQDGVKNVGYGNMVVLIPDSVREKMENNSEYAEKVLNNLSNWKKQYDAMDDALSVSYGDDPAFSKLTNSFCIALNEDGQVDNYAVISTPQDAKSGDGFNGISKDKEKVVDKKVVKEVDISTDKSKLTDTEINRNDYIIVAGTMATGMLKIRKNEN